MKKDYRIGVLGSGFIVSECHLVSYRKMGYSPVAIASRTKANAEKAAGRFGIETVYDDYEALLDDASIEVLDIAVPPQQQPGLIRAACERGTAKAILAQKPLALELVEGRALVEACEAAGILLAVNQNMPLFISKPVSGRVRREPKLSTSVLVSATILPQRSTTERWVVQTSRLTRSPAWPRCSRRWANASANAAAQAQ